MVCEEGYMCALRCEKKVRYDVEDGWDSEYGCKIYLYEGEALSKDCLPGDGLHVREKKSIALWMKKMWSMKMKAVYG